jgi:hypothetical protein
MAVSEEKVGVSDGIQPWLHPEAIVVLERLTSKTSGWSVGVMVMLLLLLLFELCIAYLQLGVMSLYSYVTLCFSCVLC